MFVNARAFFLTTSAILAAVIPTGSWTKARPADAAGRSPASFTNPLVAAEGRGGSADPSVVFHDGHYYYCRSIDDRAIGIARAERLQDIGSAPMRTVWTAPHGTAHSAEVWAPELQRVQGRWYIYFAASDGTNATHRMYALRSVSDDPNSAFEFKGKIAARKSDEWAIDGLMLEHDGSLYFMWSGWRRAGDGFPQVTYIARMSDPLTISGERHEIAAPDREWERAGAPLTEGHAILRRGRKIFVVYSTSASWTDDYKLGMLTFSGGNILDRSAWRKSPLPVFSKLPRSNAFGPGHNSFVKSPDGTEDWIVYHAIDVSGGGWSRRSVRAQPFHWHDDGTPDFGVPVALGKVLREPSGTPAVADGVQRASPASPAPVRTAAESR